MADTGESRQISGRANAHEAEAVRASKKMVSQERSTEKESNASFNGAGKGDRRRGKDNKPTQST